MEESGGDENQLETPAVGRSRAAEAATVMPPQLLLSWLSATHQPAQLFKAEGVELHVCIDPYVGRTNVTNRKQSPR